MPSISHSHELVYVPDTLRLSQGDDPSAQELSALKQELDYYRSKGILAARELDIFRQRRVVQIMERLRNRNDVWNLMHAGFDKLKDDCRIFHAEMDGFILQPSFNLSRVPYLSYQIRLDRPNLKGIMLAGIMDFPLFRGDMTVKVLLPGQSELDAVESSLPVTMIRDNAPTLFEFAPIPESHEQVLTVKVVVSNLEGPLRLFEMRRYTWFGLGPIESKIFAGFVFE